MSSEWDRRMALRLADPDALPEHHLWTLKKGARTAEARTRMVPIGLGRPELRFYVSSRETGETTLAAQTRPPGPMSPGRGCEAFPAEAFSAGCCFSRRKAANSRSNRRWARPAIGVRRNFRRAPQPPQHMRRTRRRRLQRLPVSLS